jgi:hypothetical protein
MRTNEPRKPTRALACAVLTAVTATLAACGGGHPTGQPSTSPPPTAPSSPSVDPSVAAASAQVLAVYNAYLQATKAANATADYQSADLKKYTTSPLQQQVIAQLYQNNQHGAVYKGEFISNPKVVDVRLSADPPTATVEDCIDYTNYRLVYKANNLPVPVASGGRRFVVATTAKQVVGQGWLLSDAHSYRERSC